MAKIFYVRERSGDYTQINFFKTEKEALEYGISEWPDFDMFGDEEDEDDEDGTPRSSDENGVSVGEVAFDAPASALKQKSDVWDYASELI